MVGNQEVKRKMRLTEEQVRKLEIKEDVEKAQTPTEKIKEIFYKGKHSWYKDEENFKSTKDIMELTYKEAISDVRALIEKKLEELDAIKSYHYASLKSGNDEMSDSSQYSITFDKGAISALTISIERIKEILEEYK